MNQRSAYWDNIKFFLILMVVIGHFVDVPATPHNSALFLFIYSFHIPAFLFVSGMFYKDTGMKERVFGFILLYILMKAIALGITLFFSPDASFSLLSTSSAEWYVLAMAVFTLLTYGLRNYNKRIILIFNILLALLAGYDSSIGDFLILSRIIVFFPFFLAGTMVDRERLERLCAKPALKYLSLIVIVVWGWICYSRWSEVTILRHLFTGRNPYDERVYSLGGFYRLLTYFISCAVAFSIFCLVPQRELGVITKFGSRTLQVYFWHYPIQKILVGAGLRTFLLTFRAGTLLLVAVAVMLTLLLSLRWFSFPTSNVMKLARKSSHKPHDSLIKQDQGGQRP